MLKSPQPPISDYHMHTPLCGHAVGNPEEYAEHAIKIGLKEIGFSDHSPLIAHERTNVAMKIEQLPEYHRMIESVKEQYQDWLSVKIALEADYIEGHEKETRRIVEGYPYDYVIGSVHFIGEWGFDNPAESEGWKARSIDEIYRTYYNLLRKSAASRMFQIMGHVDLVKKFGHRPVSDFSKEIQETAEVFKTSGVAVEINTAGLSKPVKEIYPALEALKIFRGAGIPLTFGSDAHAPAEVGRDYDKALELALGAGYKEYVLFKNRKIEKVLSLK